MEEVDQSVLETAPAEEATGVGEAPAPAPVESSDDTTAPTEQKGAVGTYTEAELCPKFMEGCEDAACGLGLHPTAPNGNKVKRVCDFYLSERGCAKGERCDFLHCYGKPKAKMEPPPKPLCAFYLTPKGCIKDDRCDFWHPKAPDGSTSKRICEYFNSPRGCAKEARCDFLHVEKRHLPATALSGMSMPGMMQPGFPPMTPPVFRGSTYPPGAAAAFGFPGWGGAAAAPAPVQSRATEAQRTGNGRVCSFYNSARGCAKGDRCDFVHQGADGSKATPNAPPSVAYPPAAHAVDPAAAAAAAASAYGAYDAYGAAYDMYAAYGGAYAGYGGYGTTPDAGAVAGATSAAGMGGANPYASMAGSGAGTASTATATATNGRVCSFFSSPRGCIKGDRCEFVHTAAAGAGAVRQTRPSARYAPY